MSYFFDDESGNGTDRVPARFIQVLIADAESPGARITVGGSLSKLINIYLVELTWPDRYYLWAKWFLSMEGALSCGW
jgi:hypothetical protein